jgi:hypothetical protein
MPIEIGHLAAPARAKSRGNPLRQEDRAASRTAHLKPFAKHPPSNSAHLRFWLSWWRHGQTLHRQSSHDTGGTDAPL